MAKQVVAYEGWKGKLYPTEDAAEKSFLFDRYHELKDTVDAVLLDKMRVCAFRPAMAISAHSGLVRQFLDLEAKLNG